MRISSRYDLMRIANLSRFFIRHYARGVYPTAHLGFTSMPVNRLFFCLKNGSGTNNYIRDDKDYYILQENHLYFVPAFHEARFHLDEELLFLSIQTNLELFPGVELFSSCSKIHDIAHPEELDKLLEIFDSEAENSFIDIPLKLKSIIFSLQISLLDYYEHTDFEQTIMLKEYNVFVDYLHKSVSAKCKVSDLAHLLNMSRENFTRNFSQQVGITPKQLIDRFLVSKSFDLLGQKITIKEVAFILEFSSEFAFSRFFKQQVGMSPRDWRKHWA